MREQPGPPGAPVLMLLHGWSATADLNWHHCFGPLAKQFRVLAIDHRGHGRGLRHDGPFTLEDCADDVAALAAQLGIERLIAVGYSMGGPIAQLLWQRHRSLVDGLVLCSTSAVFGSTARLRALFRVAAGLSAARATGTVSSLASSALGAVSRWNGRGGEVPWAVEQLARHDWKQVIEAGHQIGRYDARAWIGSVSVPTAVVATTADEVVPARTRSHSPRRSRRRHCGSCRVDIMAASPNPTSSCRRWSTHVERSPTAPRRAHRRRSSRSPADASTRQALRSASTGSSRAARIAG